MFFRKYLFYCTNLHYSECIIKPLTRRKYCGIIIRSGIGIYSGVGMGKTDIYGKPDKKSGFTADVIMEFYCVRLFFQADFLYRKGILMDKRLAVTAIVIDDPSAVQEVNNVLHEYSEIIIGRMGIPYRERGIFMISVALDADPDRISSLTGRLGQIKGVSAKAVISKK